MAAKSMKRHVFVMLALAATVATGWERAASAAPAVQLRTVSVVADDATATVSLNLAA